jgi:hypothetical protein
VGSGSNPEAHKHGLRARFQSRVRPLRVAVVGRVVVIGIFFVVAFVFLFVFFLVGLLSKEDIGSYQPIRRV